MALRRRLAKRRAKKIKDKIEKLKGLKDVMKAAGLDESGVDADAYRIMQDAIRQSWQQGRKLPVVAKEILKDHKPPEPSALATSAPPTDDKIVVEERKQMQTEKPWTSILHAAYEVFNQKKGRRAEHDRQALEVLHQLVHQIEEEPLKRGFEGGGGIKLKPPLLVSPGEINTGEIARPEIDPDKLAPYPVVKQAIKSLDKPWVEAVASLRQQLEEYAILPPTIAAALMAEFARRTPDAPPATEKQQVDLLQFLNLGRVIIDNGTHIRVRPPKLGPAPEIKEIEQGARGSNTELLDELDLLDAILGEMPDGDSQRSSASNRQSSCRTTQGRATRTCSRLSCRSSRRLASI